MIVDAAAAERARKVRERRRREDPTHLFKPSDQHRLALDSLADPEVRILFCDGDNRSGKTQLGATLLATLLLGPPYPDWFTWKDPPWGDLNIWLVVPSLPKNSRLQPWFQKLIYGEPGTDEHGNAIQRPPLLPPRVRANTFVRHNPTVITVKVGKRTHTVTLLTSQMASVEFGGTNPDAAFCDEPTRDDIWTELKIRMIANPKCKIIYTATDATGQAAHVADLLDDQSGMVACHRFTASGNPYIDKKTVEKVAATLSKEDRDVRLGGKGSRKFTGLVYPDAFNWPKEWKHPSGARSNFLSVDWMDEHFPEWRNWPTYFVHDPGVNNAAATVGCKASPHGDIYLHNGIYAESPGQVIAERVDEIKECFQGERIAGSWIDPKGSCFRPMTAARLIVPQTVRDMYESCGWNFKYGPDSQEQMGRRERALQCIEWIAPTGMRPMLWIVDGPWAWGLKKELRRYKWVKATNLRGETWDNSFTTARKWDHNMYCMETLAMQAYAGQLPYLDPKTLQRRSDVMPGADVFRPYDLVKRRVEATRKREKIRL